MNDLQVRLQAFDWLKKQLEIFTDLIPREILLSGFKVELGWWAREESGNHNPWNYQSL